MNMKNEIAFVRALALVIGLVVLSGAAFAQHQSSDVGFAVTAGNNQVYVGGQVTGPIPPKAQNSYLGGNGDSFIQAYDQNGNVLWTAEYGSTAQDRVLGIAADSTGVYTGGFTMGAITGQKFYGSTDAYVAKYSLTGQQLWLHEFGGPGVDRIQAVATDGTYLYTTGYTSESIYSQPFQGGQDCFVQKWTQSGTLLWTTEFGSPGTDRCYGVVANAKGVFIAGRTDNVFAGQTSAGLLDGIVAQFDGNGNMVWLKQFGTSEPDRAWGIAADSSGIYVTGRFGGSYDGQPYLGGDDSYIVKFSFTGTQMWVSEFGTSAFERGNGVAVDSTGVYGIGLTLGTFPGNLSLGSDDCYIGKWSTAGKPVWMVQFGSTGLDQCWGTATDSTGVYVSGEAGTALPAFPADTNGGFILEKYSTAGALLWSREVQVPTGSSGSVASLDDEEE
jgi:hypothetical protein